MLVKLVGKDSETVISALIENARGFHYDSENRLIRAQTWQGTTLSSEARYHYDALGRRIGKQVTQDGQTQETKFLWQGLRLLQEQQSHLHSLYLYEPDSYAPLARIDSDPELPEQEARHYYFHTDQIGTPQEMTNAEGHVVWRAYYKAWGGLEALSPNLVDQNLRFQGQYHDRESGLYYNTFRYYDPAVGRFTTQDPIGLMGGDNLYTYASNPTSWVDPFGLTCTKIFNKRHNISKKWVGKLSGKSPDQVEILLKKKGYTRSTTNLNTNKTQHTQFTRVTKSGNTDVLDYHPGGGVHESSYWKVYRNNEVQGRITPGVL